VDIRYNNKFYSFVQLSVEKQVCAGLAYLGTNATQCVVGTALHVDQATICRAQRTFVAALCGPEICQQFIRFPTGIDELRTIKEAFFAMHRMPCN